MGMAASQARFLGLTARKTNVEYEGQQINQQRTSLGNQSANYYNDLLGMSVPVPPSVDNFTKTVYTFSDGALTNSITSMITKNDGTFTVSYLKSWVDNYSVVSAATSVVNNKATAGGDLTQYRVGAQQLRKMDPASVVDFAPAEIEADPYLKSLSETQRIQLRTEEKAYVDLLNTKYGNHDWAVRYIQNNTTGAYVPNFYNLDELGNTAKVNYDDNGNSRSSVSCYTIGSEQKTEEVKAVEDCRVEQDTTGRLINISIPDADGQNRTNYALATNTITDNDRYEDAMNKYEYDKYQYDQKIQDINSKIAIIQAEDKNLELRLKQLDTEQKAIQTEMDAVTKVVEKNVEKTFNTFG